MDADDGGGGANESSERAGAAGSNIAEERSALVHSSASGYAGQDVVDLDIDDDFLLEVERTLTVSSEKTSSADSSAVFSAETPLNNLSPVSPDGILHSSSPANSPADGPEPEDERPGDAASMSMEIGNPDVELPPNHRSSEQSQSLDQPVLASLATGCLRGENSSRRPNQGLHGILKHQKPLSPIEKMVTDCLFLLCETADEDKREVCSLIRSCGVSVFKGLCVDQFFQKGECYSSVCNDQHRYSSHNFTCSSEELWFASLYVIRYAPYPNFQIIEHLVHHYAVQDDYIRALLFAKCIPKVWDNKRLELAHLIINKMSSKMPIRDVTAVILMLNFSELAPGRFNFLMEGLGVFDENFVHYRELFVFLNFNEHMITADLLTKMFKEPRSVIFKDDMVQSILGFLKRLPHSQKNELKPFVEVFMDLNKLSTETLDVQDFQPSKNRLKTKAKVIFADVPHVREFNDDGDDVPETTVEVSEVTAVCNRTPEVDEVLDFDSVVQEAQEPSIFDSVESVSDIITSVFGQTCNGWMLNGQCTEPLCSSIHDFDGNYLTRFTSQNVCLAADFIIDHSVSPHFRVLKSFIAHLAGLMEIAQILKFRYCNPKLSDHDKVELTKSVISLLGERIGRWNAIEKVLVPDILEYMHEQKRFAFDEELLLSIMTEAINSRETISLCVRNSIVSQVYKLQSSPVPRLMQAMTHLVEKFVLGGRPSFPPLSQLPPISFNLNLFPSEFKVALHEGVPDRYLKAVNMIMQVVNGSMRFQASDILYEFLLGYFDKVSVLSNLLQHCKLLDGEDKASVKRLIGTVAVRTAVQLHYNENHAESAELFGILKSFQINFLNFFSYLDATELDLAVIYCTVMVETLDVSASPTQQHQPKDYILTFFDCLDMLLTSEDPNFPPQVIELTAKMFKVFTVVGAVKESLELYKGIADRQKSLVSPINVVEFAEPVLKSSFRLSYASEIRNECLNIYLQIVDSQVPVTFQKETHRSVFLIGVMVIYSESLKYDRKKKFNVLHPLIKKLLKVCIRSGVYHDIDACQMTLNSWMTFAELTVYVLWWSSLHVRARKRLSLDYFYQVPVNVVQDFSQYSARPPVHVSIRNVPASVADCARRFTEVVKAIGSMGERTDMIPGTNRSQFDITSFAFQALCQTAINLMVQQAYAVPPSEIYGIYKVPCVRCFEKAEVKLNKM